MPFSANTNYTIFVNGLVANVWQANGFHLLAIENSKCDAADNTTDVIVLHSSPNAPAGNVTLDNVLDASIENIRTDHSSRILEKDGISSNTITIESNDTVVMPWMISMTGEVASYDPDAVPEEEPVIEMATIG